MPVTNRIPTRRRAPSAWSRRPLVLVMAGMVLAAVLTPVRSVAAEINVGPVDPSTGFPFWVAADDGTRLDLCLDGPPACLAGQADLVPPEGEAFWFNAGALVEGAGASGLVEVATEAAFAGEGAGQQIAFNRVRIRLDVTEPGTYDVAYPYGTKTFVVTEVGDGTEINDTQDVGCVTPPCGDFAELGSSGDGGVGVSFLQWSPVGAAPEGFLGDGLTPHAVTGSPVGQNYVEVTRTHGADGVALATPEVVAHQDQFAVQGKIARPRVAASPAGGSFQTPVTVTLTSSEIDAEVRYTTDGSEPTATSTLYTGPFEITADTTVKAVNVVAGEVVTDPVTGQPSAATTHTYVVDATAPEVTATPPGGTYASGQEVTLSAVDDKDASPRIYFTRADVLPGGADPADPTVDSTLYTGPISVNGNNDGATTVVKAIAVDAAGNVSAVVRHEYVIQAPTVSADPRGGSYGQAVDVRLSASDPEAAIYYTTDGSTPSPEQGTLYTNDPIRLTGYTTLKFVAVAEGGASSTVMTEEYLIDIPENRGPGALAAFGPVDSANGYPFWYADHGDSARGLDPVRLELCLDDPLCPVVGELPDPSQPLSYPDNFPDESFWWSGEAAIDTASGASALLVLAQEAAFGGAGDVSPGQQISFARLRIRINDARPGETYTVTSPYGVDVVTADGRGRVFVTEDIGCLAAPCDFSQALDGRVGPFLRWDPSVAPAAPAGYVGDPVVEHEVVGSPYGTNFFRIEGPGIGGPGVNRVETDLFAVQGRIATLQATASPGGGLYGEPTDVRITASFPAEAKIVYTTDGSTPTVDGTGAVTNGTEYLPTDGDASAAIVTVPAGLTTLRFIAVDLATNEATKVYTEEYRVETELPKVTASPDPATGPFQGSTLVTLSSSEGASIFYTVDGTTPAVSGGVPAGTTRAYTEPIAVNRPTTIRAFAVSELGSEGPVAQFDYVVQNLAEVGPVDPVHGFPFWYADYGDEPDLAPLRLELCLDDPLCPVVGELPDPNAPVSFPGNFPDEAFWWAADAAFDAGATRARLVLAAEAAFANGAVTLGDQISFGRVRLRANDLVPGATYRVTHPYGVDFVTAEPDGSVFVTDDTGCLAAPCDFSGMLRSPIGPFLRWTSGAPEGYVGDGVTPHAVTGSPFGTNVFRMERMTTGTGTPLAAPELLGETDQFTVQGKVAELRVSAAPEGGTFTQTQVVALASNDPAAEVFYTTDGSEPTEASTLYTAPIPVTAEGTTTLKFVAIAGDGSRSAVGTEVYLIDTVAPTVAADPAGGTFTSPQSVTLTSDDPTATIHYTTDGSTPTLSSAVYTSPLAVNRNLVVKARAVDPAGNLGPVGSWTFTISLAATKLVLGTPSPTTVDYGGTVSLSGSLTAAGAGLGGREIQLQMRALGATVWQDVVGATATTGADGGYSLTGVQPEASADYRLFFAGDDQYASSSSAAERVSVRAVVTLDPITGTVRRGKPVTYSGSLAPTHAGARISITATQPGQRTSTATATVGADGTWSVTTKAPGRDGSWTVVASWGGDADHLGSSSAPRTMTVQR